MERRHLLSIEDLSDAEVQRILVRSAELERDSSLDHARFVVALCFLTPSLRTRMGFGIAAARLGGVCVDVAEPRWQAGMSIPESFDDTLRTAAGMVDGLVVRSNVALEQTDLTQMPAPVINAGDITEHPTQALIDLYAVEHERGRPEELTIGVCGDLSMRAVRSLLKLLARRRPNRLVLIAPPQRDDPGVDLSAFGESLDRRDRLEIEDLDVLYLAGLPAGDGVGHLDEVERHRFTLTAQLLRTFQPESVVLSPLPLIDELDASARLDPRLRVFRQSDCGVHVRMAVLEAVLELGSQRRGH